MSRLAAVQKSNNKKPVRVMIYGIEGSGKTTFGSKAPSPIFITPEGGTDEIPGAVQLPNIKKWSDVREAIKELISGKHEYKTLVIDSADWLEKICHAHIIGESGRSIITANGGYGAGYRESEKLHRELIEDLSALREQRGMNIIITAHYQVKTVKDPSSMEDYDGFEIKCHEMVSSLWREWVDALLFVRFKTYIKTDDEGGKTRALGDSERVVYTEKRPAFQAKNRYGLPAEMNFGVDYWEQFIKATGKGNTSVGEIRKEMNELFDKIKDETVKAKIREAVEKVGNDAVALSAYRNRMMELVKGVA